MPYKSIHDLPESIKKHLPKEALSIFKSAFNAAFEEYKEQKAKREEIAHKVAWSAVKKKFVKSPSGNWISK